MLFTVNSIKICAKKSLVTVIMIVCAREINSNGLKVKRSLHKNGVYELRFFLSVPSSPTTHCNVNYRVNVIIERYYAKCKHIKKRL